MGDIDKSIILYVFVYVRVRVFSVCWKPILEKKFLGKD